MPYKIIITAGGTIEKIDAVRHIANASTGRLGCCVAQAFYAQNPANEIVYVCSQTTRIPPIPKLRLVYVSDVQSLQDTMTNLLQNEKWDAIIHAMAVSDYALKAVTTAETLATSITEDIKENGMHDIEKRIMDICTTQQMNLHITKIGSNHKHLLLTMQQTPKIIGMIKALQPQSILIGFKLLQNVNEAELIRIGHALLVQNSCDFVVANDLRSIQDKTHTGYLIKPDATYDVWHTKEEIAEAIAKAVCNQINKRGIPYDENNCARSNREHRGV